MRLCRVSPHAGQGQRPAKQVEEITCDPMVVKAVTASDMHALDQNFVSIEVLVTHFSLGLFCRNDFMCHLSRLTNSYSQRSIERGENENQEIFGRAWNVRTLLDRTGSLRPERRTATVSKELKCYSIDITALIETRLADKDLD
ncbi:hypothetical protein ElyMa_000501000 [Elysia marginata]|uniref:Uncharacterized protein n=1 Tax=Elysia marginata TaxID=1093978 RepID=A0AAV4FWK7_9GAST|nr:hypothetical protein ElyMa_000501000 [Elysia marginata]